MRNQVADGSQPEAVGSRPRHHERVDVLGGGRREHADPPAVDGASELIVRGVGVRGRRLPAQAEERRRRAGILGHELDQTAFERRRDELARPEHEGAHDGVPGGFQRLAVDLGQHDALVEVERPDGDRVIVQRGRFGRAAPG